jgi:hypothetical protein
VFPSADRLQAIVIGGRCTGDILVAGMAVYIDDSGTDPSNPIAVAAGWIAPLKNWVQFCAEWDKAKKSDSFKCFHTSDCMASNGKTEFKDWDVARKKRTLPYLVKIIRKHAVKGFGMAVQKSEYDRAIRGILRRVCGESHYTWAVRTVIGQIEEWRKAHPKYSIATDYVFDWMEPGEPKRQEIEAIFKAAEKDSDALHKYGITVNCMDFKKRCDVPPLQAADIAAWSVLKKSLFEFSGREPSDRLGCRDLTKTLYNSMVKGERLRAGFVHPEELKKFAAGEMALRTGAFTNRRFVSLTDELFGSDQW